VHPSGRFEWVTLADFNGQREFIIKTIDRASAGAVAWASAPRSTLFQSSAEGTFEKKYISPSTLARSGPSLPMYRIHRSFLLWALRTS